jgi:hypothetical protein
VSTRTKTSLIVETRRGPSVTRTTVFSVIDSLKSGHSRELIKQLFVISDEQLEAVLEYIAEHREEVEREYAEIVRRSTERREFYEQVFWDRSPFPREMPDEERRRALRKKLAKRQQASRPENERHDSSRS